MGGIEARQGGLVPIGQPDCRRLGAADQLQGSDQSRHHVREGQRCRQLARELQHLLQTLGASDEVLGGVRRVGSLSDQRIGHGLHARDEASDLVDRGRACSGDAVVGARGHSICSAAELDKGKDELAVQVPTPQGEGRQAGESEEQSRPTGDRDRVGLRGDDGGHRVVGSFLDGCLLVAVLRE